MSPFLLWMHPGVLVGDGGHSAQPLTAPESRPRVSQRWMTTKMTRLGIVASSALAASGPSRTMPFDADELREPERQRRQVGGV